MWARRRWPPSLFTINFAASVDSPLTLMSVRFVFSKFAVPLICRHLVGLVLLIFALLVIKSLGTAATFEWLFFKMNFYMTFQITKIRKTQRTLITKKHFSSLGFISLFASLYIVALFGSVGFFPS